MTDTDTRPAIAALLDEALAAGHQYVTHERFVELDTALRAEITRLATMVERLAGSSGVKHRSREWYACDGALAAADHATAYQMGTGPTACAIHVAELARRIRELQHVLDTVGGAAP